MLVDVDCRRSSFLKMLVTCRATAGTETTTQQLRTAHDIFTTIGAHAFAHRAATAN